MQSPAVPATILQQGTPWQIYSAWITSAPNNIKTVPAFLLCFDGRWFYCNTKLELKKGVLYCSPMKLVIF